jgi:multidrug resistance efflux pump
VGIKLGQPASLTVDALNGGRLTGYVSEMSPAAGSEFSVLKPDNATGNFTKIAQRIPLRIELDPNQQLADRLRPGMSVEVDVDTSMAPIHAAGAAGTRGGTQHVQPAPGSLRGVRDSGIAP